MSDGRGWSRPTQDSHDPMGLCCHSSAVLGWALAVVKGLVGSWCSTCDVSVCAPSVLTPLHIDLFGSCRTVLRVGSKDVVLSGCRSARCLEFAMFLRLLLRAHLRLLTFPLRVCVHVRCSAQCFLAWCCFSFLWWSAVEPGAS